MKQMTSDVIKCERCNTTKEVEPGIYVSCTHYLCRICNNKWLIDKLSMRTQIRLEAANLSYSNIANGGALHPEIEPEIFIKFIEMMNHQLLDHYAEFLKWLAIK